MPYIYQTVGNVSNETANSLQVALFSISVAATFLIFMTFGDKVSRRLLYFVISMLFIGSWSIFLLPKSAISLNMLILFVVLTGINNGSGQQAFYQLWSSELFPTRYRAQAQGFMFFAARICLGLWSVCVPLIMEYSGFATAAAIMTGLATISMLVGTIFAPDTSGKTLGQIERERYGEAV